MNTAQNAYNIALIRPEGYAHAAVFDEIAETVAYGLRGIGLDAFVSVNKFDPDAQNILLGSSLLPEGLLSTVPENTIIYNFEQLSSDSKWDTPAMRHLLTEFPVWDYSARNISFIETMNPRHEPHLVPVGFCEELNRIEKADVQDIDVLFYGSVNERRHKILEDLEASGLKAVKLFGVYGAERDAYIARSKVVLNMHYFETQIFEIARVSYLLANRKAVVTEVADDTEYPDGLLGGLATATYDALVDKCVELVADSGQRKALEQAAYDTFSTFRETDILKALVAGSSSAAPQGKTRETAVKPALAAKPEAAAAAAADLPRALNIGSGKDFREDCLNLDYSDYWDPDIVADLSRKDLIGNSFDTGRFGTVTLQEGMIDKIICNDVIEHIPDLVSAMTNCLNLLSDGGEFEILVPYDLSFGAWQDPTHIRAFNENSWLYYTDWHWYLGWNTHRFDTVRMDFNLNPIGQKLKTEGMQDDVLIRTPRAVDSMFTILRKRALTASEQQQADNFTSRKQRRH